MQMRIIMLLGHNINIIMHTHNFKNERMPFSSNI